MCRRKLIKKRKAVVMNRIKAERLGKRLKKSRRNISLLHMLISEQPEADITINKKAMPVLGVAVAALCNGGKLPSDDELQAGIEAAARENSLHTDDFEHIGWCIMYAACFSDMSDNDCEALFYSVKAYDFTDASALNPTEKCFLSDPAGIYLLCSEETRRTLRAMTAEIAQAHKNTEANEAIRLLELAKSSNTDVGSCITTQYARLHHSISQSEYVKLVALAPLFLSLLTGILTDNLWLAVVFYLPFWEILRCFIDRGVMASAAKRLFLLPSLDYSDSVPDEAKTTVVISAMLPDASAVRALEERLVELVTRCAEKNVKICALCDFSEAHLPEMSGDEAILSAASEAVKRLNREHDDKVILIVRGRSWCATQSKYTGYERKRGAIEQLALFAGGANIAFRLCEGDTDFIRASVFFAAVDFDTRPTLDSVRRLAATGMHPANRPHISGGRVTRGFGIIVPEVTLGCVNAAKTPFSRYFGGVTFSGTYDTRSANLYMDSFGTSIFGGKGLIDISAFREVCCGKLPEGRILSHDIIEGALLRTAFAGDIRFTESFPPRTDAYFARLHRWVRGDVQNLPFAFGKARLPFFDRFRLLDNVRRSVTSIILFRLLVLSWFMSAPCAFLAAFAALLTVITPNIIGAAEALRGCVSDFRGSVKEAGGQLLRGMYAFVLLPQNAVISLDAIIRGLWRLFVSKKNLLCWTASASYEKRSGSFARRIAKYIPAELLSCLVALSPHSLIRLTGIVFILQPFFALAGDRSYRPQKRHIGAEEKAHLFSEAAAMWQFYEDYAVKKDSYLPPDNVQFAPVARTAHRTSPTNIGLFMLSVLAARDLELIDSRGLYIRLRRTLSAVERLETYQGNPYNWYDTKTLKKLEPPFLSSVDCGNYLCCLTALREGILEYTREEEGLAELVTRIDVLVSAARIDVFYNPARRLFSLGIDENGVLSENCYDLITSEARLLSYFAVARGDVPKKHWSTLSRVIVRRGGYAGSLSYFGTMFEYFMPQLLLDSIKGSLTESSLKYCVYCQRKHAETRRLPFGISESAYNGFDGALNYQYRAHGVTGAGLKIASPDSYVVSPYSSYLCMDTAFTAARSNLSRLRELGAYGKYGYFEAIEFISGKPVLIKSYMAHHVGMSVIAAANILLDDIMKRRFMGNMSMRRAHELLEEGVFCVSGRGASGSHVAMQQKEDKSTELFYSSDIFSPSTPHIKLLSNGEYTAAVSNMGAVTAMYRGMTVYMRTTDMLRRPHGCFFALDREPLTWLPCRRAEGRSAEFGENSASFMYAGNEAQASMTIYLHSTLPCEIRRFRLKNNSRGKKAVHLSMFLEPVLCRDEDYTAHPAYSKLFISLEHDRENSLIIASRRDGFTAVMGYVSSAPMRCTFSSEDILDYPRGAESAFERAYTLPESSDYIPDPAVFADTVTELSAGEERETVFFICAAPSRVEALQSAARLRAEKLTFAEAPFKCFSAQERLAGLILPPLLTMRSASRRISSAINENKLKADALWRFGISGDLPIILLEYSLQEDDRAELYISVFRSFEICALHCELIIVYSERTETSEETRTALEAAVRRLCGDLRPNIHLINKSACADAELTLLRAAAVFIAPKNPSASLKTEITPQLCEIRPLGKPHDSEDGFISGIYGKGYRVAEKPRRPHSLMLAEPVFGTLVSESSLGFTFAKNSRLNMLTPWENDKPNSGEKIFLRCGGVLYDLIDGCAAEFYDDRAIYRGESDMFSSEVTVSVSAKGFCKKIEAEISWTRIPMSAEICYYTEPVMCGDIKKASKTRIRQQDGALLCDNLFGFEYGGVMAISSDKALAFTGSAEDVFCGKLRGGLAEPQAYPCAAVFCEADTLSCKFNVVFYLSYGADERSALQMPKYFEARRLPPAISLTVAGSTVGELCSTLLCNQIVRGRIYARAGQSQNSGAWGFRDQLQDACACAGFMPELTRRIILRCCAAQFEEGDVLHWWHRMPHFVLRGVRTHCSDDMLWLPYAVCRYIKVTGRRDILRTEVSFLHSAPLAAEEHDRYDAPARSSERASVYEHCRRAVEFAYKTGQRGLILIGSGDWNDSFSNVGTQGRGESVWLTQFMAMVLDMMCDISPDEDVRKWRKRRKGLIDAVDSHCWDGQWYRRAYCDDGQILGSHKNTECRIDSISQSFACFCGMPNREKTDIALKSAAEELFDRKNGIIKLFTPPITSEKIGYVGKYPPGIRENGGQYTHAAIWLCMAMLRSGNVREGLEMLEAINTASKKYLAQFGNEPYYMTADIYTNPQCYGRGGWSLYTGAAGWFLRLIIDEVIGVRRSGGIITLSPKLPMRCKLHICGTEIELVAGYGEVRSCSADGRPVCEIPDDGGSHIVKITLPENCD